MQCYLVVELGHQSRADWFQYTMFLTILLEKYNLAKQWHAFKIFDPLFVDVICHLITSELAKNRDLIVFKVGKDI